MRSIFVDTLYWIAVVAPHDQWSAAAKRAKRALGNCTLVTTDEVLTEFLNALSPYGALFRKNAAATVRALLKNPNVRVVPQTRESFLQALRRFEQREDKEYSLVDCASMETMNQESIREVLTHDHHFEQEGYVVLIRDTASA